MHTINTRTLSPVVVVAALRVDDWARIDGAMPVDWLAGYWRGQIRAVLPQPQDDEPAAALSRLADALAVEDITEATDHARQYREMVGRPVDGGTLTRMIVSVLLDWSRWTGNPRIDDDLAQSWIKSLLA